MPVKKPIIHCETLVVHCMDYRLQKFLHPWITVRFGYDNFDIVSLAGSVHDYEMVLKYVSLAVQIHSIETVCLINHEDCRAYGRDGTYKRQWTSACNPTSTRLEANLPFGRYDRAVIAGGVYDVFDVIRPLNPFPAVPALLDNPCKNHDIFQAGWRRSGT